MTEADVRLRDAVIAQLDWDPQVDASAVAVAARHGTVALSGSIGTYAGKLAAERAAKRVHGVRAVANDIEVSLRGGRTDADVAEDATSALELRSMSPEAVQAVVHQGYVTLTGTVEWLYQKENAERAVRHIRDVRGVHNYIKVVPKTTVRNVRERIVKALHHNADVDARRIGVTVLGENVTLTGTVATWLQRESAEQAAANAPGIAHVDNRIVVQSFHDSKIDEWEQSC